MLKRFKQAWKRDRLGVLGVSSAVVAFALWAFPFDYCGAGSGICTATQVFFTTERLPAIAALLALSFVLLLLRRR
jgi:hypothetical protein